MNAIRTLLTIFILVISLNLFAKDFKQADLAGVWYPRDSKQISFLIEKYLSQAEVDIAKGEIIGIISPHAGINYSGKIAAFGFKALADKKVDKVVVVGFSHRLSYDEIAVLKKPGYKTPLGVLPIDKNISTNLVNSHLKINYDSAPFYKENSVEMIVPFIQVALGEPKTTLVAIGNQSWENSQILGQALYESLKSKDNFVIVASTDLCHYLSPREVEAVDKETSQLIQEFDPKRLYNQCRGKNRMCGTAAVAAVMIASKKLGAEKSVVLSRSNSAKIVGEGKKAVGYLSAVFVKEKKKKERNNMGELLTESQKDELIQIARKTLNQYIKDGTKYQPEVEDNRLKEDMGVFVTLHKNNSLRGCIGNIIAKDSLYLGIRNMAIAASTQDPRFSPVIESELDDIDIEISVLSPLEKIDNPDKIILGKHGVLVRKGFKSGVFLPQVANETGWSKEEFMDNLCIHKAGLESSCWKTGDCDIFIFSAEVFRE
ncbi:MAG: AmmeMemoRadiSam system protein B [Candidatus Omnitrophica bacterium]|nr:AmmeMemoRadiSam system protein B [Candidatus Omnitrophota bacterium]